MKKATSINRTCILASLSKNQKKKKKHPKQDDDHQPVKCTSTLKSSTENFLLL